MAPVMVSPDVVPVRDFWEIAQCPSQRIRYVALYIPLVFLNHSVEPEVASIAIQEILLIIKSVEHKFDHIG